jgi:hypothetical protein
VRRADARITLIGTDALNRQADFEDRSGTATYHVYDMVPAIAVQVARLQTALAALRPSWLSRERWRLVLGWGAGNAQEQLDAVMDQAKDLDALVQQWPTLADELDKLDVKMREVQAPANELAPGLMASATDLLAPLGGGPETKEVTIEEVRALLADVPKTTAALALVPAVVQLHEDVAQLEPLQSLTMFDQEFWAEAHRLDREILVNFSLASDVAALEQGHIDELMLRLRALVRQLPASEGGRLASAELEGRPVPESGLALLSGVGRIARMFWSAVSSTRGIDLLWLLVAVAVAMWSGLTLYYFDKPWGRPADFVILFVWAFGSATLLASLLSALEDVTAGPLPFRKQKTDDDKSSASA